MNSLSFSLIHDQAHPDKVLAKELFENFPNIYKDPNHKPEMAVALTPFQALSGFRSVDDIKSKITVFPELKGFLSETCKFTYYSPLFYSI